MTEFKIEKDINQCIAAIATEGLWGCECRECLALQANAEFNDDVEMNDDIKLTTKCDWHCEGDLKRDGEVFEWTCHEHGTVNYVNPIEPNWQPPGNLSGKSQ